jgi:hypothetical protein
VGDEGNPEDFSRSRSTCTVVSLEDVRLKREGFDDRGMEAVDTYAGGIEAFFESTGFLQLK